MLLDPGVPAPFPASQRDMNLRRVSLELGAQDVFGLGKKKEVVRRKSSARWNLILPKVKTP